MVDSLPSQYDPSVMIYTGASVATAFIPTLMWNTIFKDSESLNQVGYRFAAYSSFYTWLPAALVSTFHLVKQSRQINEMLISSVKLSLFGPWLFNAVSVYYLLNFSDESLAPHALGFYGYCFSALVF